jgi:hypothetical protein
LGTPTCHETDNSRFIGVGGDEAAGFSDQFHGFALDDDPAQDEWQRRLPDRHSRIRDLAPERFCEHADLRPGGLWKSRRRGSPQLQNPLARGFTTGDGGVHMTLKIGIAYRSKNLRRPDCHGLDGRTGFSK